MSFSNDAEKQIYAEDTAELIRFFEKELDFSLYIIYGTLLGAIRQQDFIDYDTDIDLAYLSKYSDHNKVKNERELLADKLETLGMMRRRDTSGLKIAFKRTTFDIWYSWINPNEDFYLQPFYRIGPKDLLLPLQKMEFRKNTVLVPNSGVQILEAIYKTWQTPLQKDYYKRG